MQDNVWLSVIGLGTRIKSIQCQIVVTLHIKILGKIEHGDNNEWQMHNSISDASVLGCRHQNNNHEIGWRQLTCTIFTNL